MAPTLDSLVVNDTVPFSCTVRVRDEGRWVAVAQGTTPAWLREVAAEEAGIFGSAQIVSPTGTVLETVGLRD